MAVARDEMPPLHETIAIQEIDGTCERPLRGDVKDRFAIDTGSLAADRPAA